MSPTNWTYDSFALPRIDDYSVSRDLQPNRDYHEKNIDSQLNKSPSPQVTPIAVLQTPFNSGTISRSSMAMLSSVSPSINTPPQLLQRAIEPTFA